MSYSLIASASAADFSAATTSAIDTTGADLIWIGVADYSGSTGGALSDSKGNTWTQIEADLDGSNGRITTFYCQAPTVGSGHTFTYSATFLFGSIAVIAVSGSASTPLDQTNHTASSFMQPTVSTGSITPAEDNEIIFAAVDFGSGVSSATIDSGFTIQEQLPYSGWIGIAVAYLIQTSAGAVNPTWTFDATPNFSVTSIVSFKAGGGGGSILSSYYYQQVAQMGGMAL